jgi:hypothetical protein
MKNNMLVTRVGQREEDHFLEALGRRLTIRTGLWNLARVLAKQEKSAWIMLRHEGRGGMRDAEGLQQFQKINRHLQLGSATLK